MIPVSPWSALTLAISLLAGATAASAASGTSSGDGAAASSYRLAQASRGSARASGSKACEAQLRAGNVDGGLACLRRHLAELVSTQKTSQALQDYSTWAQSFESARRPTIAQQLFEEGLASKAAAEPSLERGHLHFFYARFLEKQERLEPAIVHARQAQQLIERFKGPRHYDTISANDLLGALLVNTGSVAIGMNIGERNFELARDALGDEEPLTWRTANNYAEALRSIGHPQAARPIDEFLLAKRVKRYGEGSIQALVSASNAGLNCLALGDAECTLRYFALQRRYGAALADRTSEHVPQAEAWIRYAQAHFAKDLLLAKRDLEAMAALKDWRSSPDLLRVKATVLAAEQYEKRGDRARGIALRQEASKIAAKAFHPTNPITSEAELGLADAHARNGDEQKALEILKAMDARLLEWMLREIGNAGNRFTAENTRAIADNFLFSFAQLALTNDAARAAFADTVGRWKAMESGERSQLRLIVDRLPEDGTRALARDVIRLQGQQQEIMSSRRTAADREHDEAVIAELRAKTRSLQDRMGPLPADTDRARTIAAALGDTDALVNFVALSRRRPSLSSDDAVLESRLMAVIRRKAAAPSLIDLGDLGELAAGTQAATGTIEPGATLFKTLVEPLRPHLAGVARLFVVPDGPLYGVPFALLQSPEGRHLDELYEVHMLTREDALPLSARNDRLTTGGRAVLAGGLDFSKGADTGPDPIPFSRQEVDGIAAILGRAGYRTTVLTGTEGTEAALRKDAPGAEVIHLATHGFFVPGGDNANALWRSGLVLSHSGSPGKARADGQDGTLYAQELLDWDLSAASLVVLSACETARGGQSRIDAVRGLPMALGIAGARRFVLTLWAIDDEGAGHFMARFYEHAAAGGTTYAEALRRTRLEAITGRIPGAGDPGVWGAFVMFEN